MSRARPDQFMGVAVGGTSLLHSWCAGSHGAAAVLQCCLVGFTLCTALLGEKCDRLAGAALYSCADRRIILGSSTVSIAV
jgi:hypothetical protein